MRAAAARVPDLPEWHDAGCCAAKRAGRPSATRWSACNARWSRPPRCTARRLGYDEMLAHQLAMAWMKAREKHRPGRAAARHRDAAGEALRRFGFPIRRPARSTALAEIDADMAAPRRMLRLLQGDVGSGKTLVALLAMLGAVEAGAQAALMAPTEVLAKQHLRTLERLAPCPVGLLTGSVKGAERRNLLLSS